MKTNTEQEKNAITLIAFANRLGCSYREAWKVAGIPDFNPYNAFVNSIIYGYIFLFSCRETLETMRSRGMAEDIPPIDAIRQIRIEIPWGEGSEARLLTCRHDLVRFGCAMARINEESGDPGIWLNELSARKALAGYYGYQIKFAMRELQQFELDRVYAAFSDIERMMHTDFSFYLIDYPLKDVFRMYMDSLEGEERDAVLARSEELRRQSEENEQEEKRKERERQELIERKKEETRQRREKIKQKKEEAAAARERRAQAQRELQARAKERRRREYLEAQEKEKIQQEERERQAAAAKAEAARRQKEEEDRQKEKEKQRQKKRVAAARAKKERREQEAALHTVLAEKPPELVRREKIIAIAGNRPEDAFPDTRTMHRKFILHVGPTNSGKTYEALERLKKSTCGGYFGPLRLLAMEVYEKCNRAGAVCSLFTGEERVEMPGETCRACTIETLDLEQRFDVVVLDECQMIQNPERGYRWTRAILGVMADEIHLCMSTEAYNLIIRMIERCGDEYELVWHTRKTRLVVEEKEYDLETDLREGDAIIVFSRRRALDLSYRLRQSGFPSSVIYGNMPPKSRRQQVERYLSGKNKIVVSTDAIGMGLNLPIRRVVFTKVEKFNGREQSPISPMLIRQIAGRAGRYGMYDVGYVTATRGLDVVREALSHPLPPLEKAYIGFPGQLLDMPDEIGVLLEIWRSLPDPPLYQKTDLSEKLKFLHRFQQLRGDDFASFSNQVVWNIISCPMDNSEEATALWERYCLTFDSFGELEFPRRPSGDIYHQEMYYKMLELYLHFSMAVGTDIQRERLEKELERTEQNIDRILSLKYAGVKRCCVCGTKLPPDSPQEYCDHCLMVQMRHSKMMGKQKRKQTTMPQSKNKRKSGTYMVKKK